MANMKRIMLIVFTIVLACQFTACGGAADTEKGENTLTITFPDGEMGPFINTLREKFPDINFEITQYEGVSSSPYLLETALSGDASDLFFYKQPLSDEVAAKYLIDLSGYDFADNFDASILSAFDVDGAIYQIPGPIMLRFAAYNRTLFEEHGWKVPTNFDEMVDVCRQIRQETDDITPIAMSLAGVGYAFTTVTTFSQAGFLSTPAGSEWEKRFLAGEASLAEGWGEGLEMTARLIDAGAFNAKQYVGLWDADAMELEFAKGKAAMAFIWLQQSDIIDMMNNSEYEYGLMPFYGYEDGDEVLGITVTMAWGIPKRLEEKGNEKKLENALRVMEWFSTEEAQQAMKTHLSDGEGTTTVSGTELMPLKKMYVSSESSPLKDLWSKSANGYKAFMVYSGYESIIFDVGEIIQNAMLANSSEGMIENVIRTGDSLQSQLISLGKTVTVIGTVEENMDEAQTTQLLVNVINERGYGDFSLMTHTGTSENNIHNRSGAAGTLYKGELTSENSLTIVGIDSNSLETLSVSGAKVKELLQNGKTLYSSSNPSLSATWDYYWAGLDVSMKNGEIVSVKYEGKELEDDKEYHVTVVSGDYPKDLAACASAIEDAPSVGTVWKDYLHERDSVNAPEVLRTGE